MNNGVNFAYNSFEAIERYIMETKTGTRLLKMELVLDCLCFYFVYQEVEKYILK